MDFLRDLIHEGLSHVHKTTIMDIIFISLPENQLKRNQEFLTEIFKTVMDYLLTSDMFNEHSSPTQTSNIPVIMQNFFNLIDQLVDKLWDGSYRREAREVFEMIVKLQANLKKKCYNQVSNEQLVNSLNRVLLYQLSRPCDTLVEQVCMLEVLHKITNLKSLIFSQSNFQSEFFACVTHCLLMLTLSEEAMASLSDYSNINMVG